MERLSCKITPKIKRAPEAEMMIRELVEITTENMRALKTMSSMIKESHNFTPEELRGIDIIMGAAELKATDIYQIRSMQ